jgi:UDP-N-acetyl-2-amino-2-deoxyglucuronate dehydrogenase
MTDLQVAIVGCGIIGFNHARAIDRVDGLRVGVLIDPRPGAANELADEIASASGASPAIFRDTASAYAAGGIDIVSICTPSGLHVQQAEAALATGAHVVIEKPVDVTIARARRIAELAAVAEADGRVVSVISQHRFDPASRVVAEAAHGGRFGRLTSAVASVPWWRNQDYYDSSEWRGTLELDGGGAVMNQGVHTVDLLVWFLGTPISVFAQTALLSHAGIEVEDVAVATLRFESGALAVLHATTAAYPGGGVRIQVHGDRGTAVLEDDRLALFITAPESDTRHSGVGAVDRSGNVVPPGDTLAAARPADSFIAGHTRQFEDIVAAIRERRAPGVRVADALLSLAVVRALYLSAALGESVRVADVLDGSVDESSTGRGSGA